MTVTPSLDQFRELARQGNLIPVVIDIVADNETPISAFAKIQDDGEYCFLFESAETNEQSGRFSFIGLDPILKFQSNGSTISLTEEGVTRTFPTRRDPLAELETAMAKFQFVPSPDIPHFVGGAVGYVGFDVVPFFEPTVKLHARDDLQVPEMMFVIARTLIVFDHRFRRLRLVTNASVADPGQAETAYAAAQARLTTVLGRLQKPVALREISAARIEQLPAARSNTMRPEFETMVREGTELIGAGDIFQVVLSQRFETDFADNPLDLYRCLRFGNPSPYMFLLHFGDDFTAVGSSPEVHVRVRERVVEIRPIAGTRPRGRDPSEDERLAAELLADPKERAEHVMLIDLGRNDVGRVAACGSVRVTEQMVIERYSHVMHIVSHVVGQLGEGRTAFDAMRATFPAGTVSGAPKVRAMQIIGQLEKSRRGFYSGIVGYFGFDGSLDSCIALRSIVLKDGKAYWQTGAGIVADSDPGREYDECVNKGKAMLEAVVRARRMDQ
ncbi:MAG TPA: anthranilate synthase component I [Chthoniobacterales bacterium]|jgi:anthranilate synthase component 1